MMTIARTTKVLTGMGLATVLLAGCVGQQLGVAKSTAAGGGTFDKALYSQYLKLSRMEYSEADYTDSDVFANRAIAAASGNPAPPEMVGARKIPPEHVGALKSAYRQLNEVLDVGSVRLPKLAAMAQSSFECWMQEQEENLQPADIAKCKSDFSFAMGALKAGTAPKMKKKKKKVAAAPAPAPKLKARRYEKYIVLFDHDSSKISKGETKPVNKAVLTVDNAPPRRVIVTGYADRSGNADYNKMLSDMRAKAVAALLDENSSTDLSGIIEIKSYGEERNEVDTADGKREPKNRRVKIDIIR